MGSLTAAVELGAGLSTAAEVGWIIEDGTAPVDPITGSLAGGVELGAGRSTAVDVG